MGKPQLQLESCQTNKVTSKPTKISKVKNKADSLRKAPSPSHWSQHSKNDSARIKADPQGIAYIL